MLQLSRCLGDREHTTATVLSNGVSVWEDSSVVENLPSMYVQGPRDFIFSTSKPQIIDSNTILHA